MASCSDGARDVATSGTELRADGNLGRIVKVVSSLQNLLKENESTITELQEKAGDLDEKIRQWTRRTDRAEAECKGATKRAGEVQAAAAAERKETALLVDRYMEAEVLRSKLTAAGDQIERSKGDVSACHTELAKGYPMLAEEEERDCQLGEAINRLERHHTGEITDLQTKHHEKMAEERAKHATLLAERESMYQQQLTALRVGASEEQSALRAKLEDARWQAEVYVREQQDAIREVCLRQRENARIARRHGEARQEALELAVRLEALRAAEDGAPAREAEVHALRKRQTLLQRIGLEWHETLEKKRADCEMWRRRAIGRGFGHEQEDDELTGCEGSVAGESMIGKLDDLKVVDSADTFLSWRSTSMDPAPFEHRVPSLSRCSSGTTMSRHSNSTPNLRAAQPQGQRRQSHSQVRQVPSLRKVRGHARKAPPSSPHRSVDEFLGASLRAAQLRAEAEQADRIARTLPVAPDSAAADEALVTAENEVEMLTFLLRDDELDEVETLLEFEAQRQLPAVARRLRTQLNELSRRVR